MAELLPERREALLDIAARMVDLLPVPRISASRQARRAALRPPCGHVTSAHPPFGQWLDGVEPTWTLLTFRGFRPYSGDETICFFAGELRQPG